ncbi:hypothetical protein HWV62_15667 [Athelia sp. TMB]|nr:hypothetical protein HWV62_15667 [Athelia sp. TMB]
MAPKASREQKTKKAVVGNKKAKQEKETKLNSNVSKMVESTEKSVEAAANREDTLEWEEELARALLGYGMLVLTDGVLFGQWNDRALIPNKVTELVDNFEQFGLNNAVAKWAIPLCVEPEWLNTEVLVAVTEVRNVMDIEWTAARPPNIDAAGGHHRCAALGQYNTNLGKKIASIRGTLDKLRAKSDFSGTQIKAAEAALEAATRDIGLSTKWLGAFYDKTSLSDSALIYLSRNTHQPEAVETQEEVLSRAVKKLDQALAADVANIDNPASPSLYSCALAAILSSPEVKGRSVIRKSFYSPNLTRMMVDVRRLGPLFVSAKFLNATFLQSLQGVIAGVSSFSISQQAYDLDRLLMVISRPFKYAGVDLFEDHEAMEGFLACGDTEQGKDEWYKKAGVQWDHTYSTLRTAFFALDPQTVNLDRRPLVKLMAPWNATYVTYIQERLPRTVLRLSGHHDYKSLMVQYTRKSIVDVEASLKLLTTTVKPQSFESQIRSKIRLLTFEPNLEMAPAPLLTPSYAVDMIAEWAEYTEALKEFTRWFEPLADFWYLSTGNYGLRDYTEILLKVLSSPHLAGDNPRAIRRIVECLFSKRSTCLKSLSIALAPWAAKRKVTTGVYKAAWATAINTERSDVNPIVAHYHDLPFSGLVDKATRLLKTELSKPTLSVPSSAFRGEESRADMPWADVAVNTAFPWRQFSLSSWGRESPLLAVAMIYEHFLVQEYRSDIIQGSGGSIRHVLFTVLHQESLLSPSMVFIDPHDKHWLRFADRIYLEAVDAPNAKQLEAELATIKLEKCYDAEIIDIVKRMTTISVAQLSTSRNASGDGPHLAIEVLDATKVYVKASAALFLNRQRSLLRSRTSKQEPFFTDKADTLEDHPEVVFPRAVVDFYTGTVTPSDPLILERARLQPVDGKAQSKLPEDWISQAAHKAEKSIVDENPVDLTPEEVSSAAGTMEHGKNHTPELPENDIGMDDAIGRSVNKPRRTRPIPKPRTIANQDELGLQLESSSHVGANANPNPTESQEVTQVGGAPEASAALPLVPLLDEALMIRGVEPATRMHRGNREAATTDTEVEDFNDSITSHPGNAVVFRSPPTPVFKSTSLPSRKQGLASQAAKPPKKRSRNSSDSASFSIVRKKRKSSPSSDEGEELVPALNFM